MAAAAKPGAGRTPDDQKRLAEVISRMPPKDRKRLAKTVKRMTPEQRKKFVAVLKQQKQRKQPLAKKRTQVRTPLSIPAVVLADRPRPVSRRASAAFGAVLLRPALHGYNLRVWQSRKQETA